MLRHRPEVSTRLATASRRSKDRRSRGRTVGGPPRFPLGAVALLPGEVDGSHEDERGSVFHRILLDPVLLHLTPQSRPAHP